jgi:hypothetical protein
VTLWIGGGFGGSGGLGGSGSGGSAGSTSHPPGSAHGSPPGGPSPSPVPLPAGAAPVPSSVWIAGPGGTGAGGSLGGCVRSLATFGWTFGCCRSALTRGPASAPGGVMTARLVRTFGR